MSHEVETMAYSGEVPWHRLGTNVEYGVSTEEFLEAAGLNWEVETRPMFYYDYDGNVAKTPKRALIRKTDGRLFSVVGENWKPVQNKEVFDFMKDFVQAGGITLETAGALYGGRVMWGLAKLNHTFEPSPGDVVNGYLLVTSPHELGKALSVKTTTVRVVCHNTLTWANSHGQTETNYSQSHIHKFNVQEAQEAVANAHEQLMQAAQNAKTLRKLKLSVNDAMEKVIQPVFNPEGKEEKEPKAIRQIQAAMEHAPGAEPGNGWGAMNAVTYFADHMAGKTPSVRLANSWAGANSAKKLKVQKKLLEMAE